MCPFLCNIVVLKLAIHSWNTKNSINEYAPRIIQSHIWNKLSLVFDLIMTNKFKFQVIQTSLAKQNSSSPNFKSIMTYVWKLIFNVFK